MKGPFQVAEDEPGCAHCGQGKTWTVVDAEDTAIGQSWGQDSEGDCPPDAYEMANLLNAVYEAALRHQVNSDARDAARYRWLRDQLERRDIPIASCVWKRDSDPDGEWVNLVNAEDLDRHIDAAGFGITTLRHVAGKKPPEDVWRTQAVLAMNQAVLEWEGGKVLGPTISLLRSLRDEGSK